MSIRNPSSLPACFHFFVLLYISVVAEPSTISEAIFEREFCEKLRRQSKDGSDQRIGLQQRSISRVHYVWRTHDDQAVADGFFDGRPALP